MNASSLKLEMQQLANEFSEAEGGLDFTSQSLEAISPRQWNQNGRLKLAAYVGEVIIRARPESRWVAGNRPLVDHDGDPAIQIGDYVADPFAAVRRFERDRKAASLALFVQNVIRASADPSDEQLKTLGLTRRYVASSPWDELVRVTSRLWHRWKRS